ncbi:MAG: hypothetical protein ACD_81C00089G0009 [uncultured bacterium]|uniref:Glycosyltransferase, group 1 family protein n=1 Tax=Candidatus Wolfebacteria bacterium GW2011_GWE2_44_13 TaxID=1619017 RepID=A0A0G1H821_9BACT|nr:MAG: hypothetical protein ACD_81C00089G0009 [uncultured bacterium]KKT43546.1 MAG: Glycosyltransferase, group 1 family protein [Candidatus Wolfebacteria bacterium GW2011_GWE2_44_13]
MKILIVVTKGEMGGAQVFVATLAKMLYKKGHDVTVAFGEGSYLENALEKSGIPVITFKWLKRSKNPFSNILFALELKRFLTLNRFDVVHVNSTNALFGAIGAKAARTKPKTIFTVHGLSILDPNYKASRLIKKLYYFIFKFLLHSIDNVAFVNKANLTYAQKIKLVKSGTVIYNGIDSENLHFLPRQNARSFFTNALHVNLHDAFILGSIGRLAYPKNYEFLINAFPNILKEIPNAICIIIGEGPKRIIYEALIKKNNLTGKVFLAGEHADAYTLIKAFDVFTLPSEYEGMSMTLIEALFAEVPILASRVGGTPEVLENPRTYILNDPDDFITKLLALHMQKDHAYSEAQKNHRKQFDGKLMTEQYEKIYQL